jgi:L-aminopeptidase/D-esterase-like protein
MMSLVERSLRAAVLLAALALMPVAQAADAPLRARDLGVPFEGTPGACNAITDVAGVEVGHATLISGDGPLRMGQGPVRTGVTAIFPKGRSFSGFVRAGVFVANGTGELTGRAMIDETGLLSGPVMFTGTGSVGVVRDAVMGWYRRQLGPDPQKLFVHLLPAVGETYDGFLNDTFGQHVRESDVFAAMDAARGGRVQEGAVGGGTGMIAHDFKGGIGTSSRRLSERAGGYMVGAIVQANYGSRAQLTIAGVPVGREIQDLMPSKGSRKDGSLLVVIATDAPVLPDQLRRVALRATHGMARVGGMSGTTSGDIFLAFSTAEPSAAAGNLITTQYIDPFAMNPLFEAAVLATEEAIVNAIVAGRSMTGIDGNTVQGLPPERLQQALRKYGRLNSASKQQAPDGCQ